DPWMVRRAYEIAAERHRDQLRSSGDPYLTHLLEVAHILADMRLDATTLTAALLHDVIEDTEFPVSRIEERFGAEVAHLVEGVTKISRLNMMARETLDIYAPIAHRLGMGIMRNELEDLSFRYLEPESFLSLQKEVTDKTPIYLRFLEEVQATI